MHGQEVQETETHDLQIFSLIPFKYLHNILDMEIRQALNLLIIQYIPHTFNTKLRFFCKHCLQVIEIPNYIPRLELLSYFGVSTCSVARVVVRFVHPNLVGVDRGGGITPLLHLDGAVPLLDPDLKTSFHGKATPSSGHFAN
jgi:hypothetical protein